MAENIERQLHTIDLLSRHELKLNELYLSFASHLPKEEDFWNSIAKEEVGHANLLQALKAGIGKEEFSLSGDRVFDDYLIQSSINKINGLIVANSDVPSSSKESLQTAYHYENSLVETDFFKVVDGDAPEVANVMNNLRDATARHAQKIKEKLDIL